MAATQAKASSDVELNALRAHAAQLEAAVLGCRASLSIYQQIDAELRRSLSEMNSAGQSAVAGDYNTANSSLSLSNSAEHLAATLESQLKSC